MGKGKERVKANGGAKRKRYSVEFKREALRLLCAWRLFALDCRAALPAKSPAA